MCGGWGVEGGATPCCRWWRLRTQRKMTGAQIKVEGVTHTWKMVFWSPTTSPSPTVRVS